MPASWRDFLLVTFCKRVRFRDGETFDHDPGNRRPLRFLQHPSSTDLYWTGEYEPGSVELFSVLCRNARVVFDVGSYGGLYAVFAASANPDAAVFAFEPSPAALEICRRNLLLNAVLTQNVELMQLALDDHDGQASLYLTGGTSSLNPAFRASAANVRVTVVRGDEIVRRRAIERLDLVKLDTESTEPAVLRGLSATLARDHPDVVCEVLRDRTETELETLLAPLGYTYYWITRDRLIRRSSIAGDPTYRFPNYLFTARSRDELAALGMTRIAG